MVVPGAHRPRGGGAAGPIRPCVYWTTEIKIVSKKSTMHNAHYGWLKPLAIQYLLYYVLLVWYNVQPRLQRSLKILTRMGTLS